MTLHIFLVKSRKLLAWKDLALPNKDDIETNFDFGNRCRFNLNGATVILFLRANLHGKEVTTTNYLFSQKYSLGGGEKGGIGAVHKQRRQLGGRKGKNGQNCRRTKKLPTWGRGVSKIWKKCRRRLWMVPKDA